MKKILVPTDLSDIAELGLKLAVEIAKRCNGSINLINFTQHPFDTTFTATGDIALKRDTEEDLFALQLLKANHAKLEQLALQYADPNIHIHTAIVDNDFRDGMDEYLAHENIDLVVMGTSGEENTKEIFTGNHTKQVIRMSNCPVLSLREDFRVEDMSNIAVAVNVITDNQLADALVSIKKLADCFNAKVHLIHVRDRASNTTLILDEYFTHMAQIAGLTNYEIAILDTEDRAEGIMNYARRVRAGLVAVIKNKREGIFRIFSHHLSDQLVQEETTPVITVNLQNSHSA